MAFLAQLLATPRADGQKPIVALVRGRQVGKPLGRQVGYPLVNLVTEVVSQGYPYSLLWLELVGATNGVSWWKTN